MEITRSVIEDLLPLYVAGEVSEDTRKLVEEYLEKDESLVQFVQQLKELHMTHADIPLKPETELVALQKIQQLQKVQKMVITTMAAIFGMTFLCGLGLLSAIYFFAVYLRR